MSFVYSFGLFELSRMEPILKLFQLKKGRFDVFDCESDASFSLRENAQDNMPVPSKTVQTVTVLYMPHCALTQIQFGFFVNTGD